MFSELNVYISFAVQKIPVKCCTAAAKKWLIPWGLVDGNSSVCQFLRLEVARAGSGKEITGGAEAWVTMFTQACLNPWGHIHDP